MESASFEELKILAKKLGIKIKRPSKSSLRAAIQELVKGDDADKMILQIQSKLLYSTRLISNPLPGPTPPEPKLGDTVTVKHEKSQKKFKDITYDILSPRQILIQNKLLFTFKNGNGKTDQDMFYVKHNHV